MKKYSFKLEPLLFKRQTMEEQKQHELAQENRVLRELNLKLEQAFEAKENHTLSKEIRVLSSSELRLFNDYKKVLEEKFEQVKSEVREQRELVKEIQTELTRLHMDTKVVEILKEKDRIAYFESLRKEEDKSMDEFSVIRHNANKRKRAENFQP